MTPKERNKLWERKIRPQLKKRFEALGLTRCEVCTGTFGLSFAHSRKRRNERTTLSESDVRDDNRDHYTPSKFGVKLCQMWIDALKTDDEQWYLDGYNLYIDKVIFNPNI